MKLKLKDDSNKQFITTNSGYTIDKSHWEEVQDGDNDITKMMLSRDDLLIEYAKVVSTKPVKKVVKKTVKKVVKKTTKKKVSKK